MVDDIKAGRSRHLDYSEGKTLSQATKGKDNKKAKTKKSLEDFELMDVWMIDEKNKSKRDKKLEALMLFLRAPKSNMFFLDDEKSLKWNKEYKNYCPGLMFALYKSGFIKNPYKKDGTISCVCYSNIVFNTFKVYVSDGSFRFDSKPPRPAIQTPFSNLSKSIENNK
jgi:hypothetical protein